MLCNHLRAIDVFVETVRYAREHENCQYYGHTWKLGSNETNEFEVCDKQNCPEMGINSENFKYNYSKANVYYISTKNRTSNCLKYFSDTKKGEYAETYYVKPYTEEIMSYIKKLFIKHDCINQKLN